MDGSTIQKTEAEKAEAFLAGLTDLSMQHGIAITGKPVLFVMEREDYEFPYRVDKDANLSLGYRRAPLGRVDSRDSLFC